MKHISYKKLNIYHPLHHYIINTTPIHMSHSNDKQYNSFLSYDNVKEFTIYFLTHSFINNDNDTQKFKETLLNYYQKSNGDMYESMYLYLKYWRFSGNNDQRMILTNSRLYQTHVNNYDSLKRYPKWKNKKNAIFPSVEIIPFDENIFDHFLTVENITNYMLFMFKCDLKLFKKWNFMVDEILQCVEFYRKPLSFFETLLEHLKHYIDTDAHFLLKRYFTNMQFYFYANYNRCEITPKFQRKIKLHECFSECPIYCDFVDECIFKRVRLCTIYETTYHQFQHDNLSHKIFTNEFIVKNITAFLY